MDNNKKVYAYLYLPKFLVDWLRQEALKEQRSFNNYVVMLLLEKYREKEMVQCTSKQ